MMMNFCIPVFWYAILAPAGTPRDGVARINSEVKRALRPE
jgi:tripartite-type tricarboxylate transporter receptor subunit TctC